MSALVFLCHRPKIFSNDIETCYPVDTVHNSPIDEYKQGMKELATKFDALTIRTVAKLHDQFGHPSAKALAHLRDLEETPHFICGGHANGSWALQGHAVQDFRADVIVIPRPCFVFCGLLVKVVVLPLSLIFVTGVWLKFAAHAKRFTHMVAERF